MNKRADGGLTAIVIIVVILVFLGWLVNLSQRQCQSNKDCDRDFYCGSDFACHQIPIIERETTPVIVNRDFTGAAWVIALAIMVAAALFNIDKIAGVFRRKPKQQDRHDSDEVYTNFPVYYEKQGSK
ncbi:MAG TPA: hypothetical protein VJH97_07545 [Candidatus Nanoarchaeia archaeon]|nr:hypothetical protein [Candidatus Nanoarchaeia archaeon]